MSGLDRDPLYAYAPLAARAVYAMLFEARFRIVEALALGVAPDRVAARVLGVDCDEARAELDRLRAAGLVGEGLTLLAGVRSGARRRTETTEPAPSDADATRAALAAYTGSRRALAAELGCSEGALRAFAAGRRNLGAGLLSALAAYLVRTSECVPECVPTAFSTHSGTHVGTHSVGTQSGTQSLSPSDSLSPSLESSLSSEISKESEITDGGIAGGSLREGAPVAVRTECVPASSVGTHPAPLALAGEARAPRRERRPKPEPAADPLPAEGTVARRVYDTITTDAALAPITRGPGDLAQRLAALCDGVPVDPVACVIEAGAWLRRGGAWRDGAGGLLRWVKRDVDRARALPAPVVGAIRAPASAERIDYQGRRVVGAAGLPPGSVWEKTKEQHEAEEDALYARAYADTQPKKGATGR